MMKLWLRVLPDLVKTSIIEQIATLTKRKTMTEKIASLVQPRTIFLKVFVAVFVITVLISVAITFLLPETYASTAQINVENDQPNTSYDPYLIQTQLKIMQSQVVLGPVIDKLNLNVGWGRKYFAGQTLKPSQTMDILQQRLQFAPVRNTKLVSITVYSDDKMEAAKIANAIAESYHIYRIQTCAELAKKKIKALPPGPERQAALLEAQTPKPSLAEITVLAEPGHAPVRPNKPLNITLGAALGVLSASALGAIAAFVAARISKGRLKSNAQG